MEKGWNTMSVAGGWRLDHPSLPEKIVYASLGKHWINFRQQLKHRAGSDPGQDVELYRQLLGINERQMFLLKFALDDEHKLMLSAELPLTGNYPKLIETVLDGFIKYGALYSGAFSDGGSVPLDVSDAATATADSQSPVVTAETYLDFVRKLELYNWIALKRPVGQSWHLGYKGRLRMYDAYFSVSPSWAVFQVPVLLNTNDSQKSKDVRAQKLFLRYLLRLNDELYLIKFGTAEDGQPLILLELPVKDLDYELFLFAIRTISKYLETYTQELEIMAAPERDAKIFNLLLQADAATNPC